MLRHRLFGVHTGVRHTKCVSSAVPSVNQRRRHVICRPGLPTCGPHVPHITRPWQRVQHSQPDIRTYAASTEQELQSQDDEEEEQYSYVDELNYEYGVPGIIHFTEGDNGLPRAWLKHPDSQLGIEVYLHGASVTSMLRPNGHVALATHPGVEMHPDQGNRGVGLRLAFPQYRAGTQMTLDDGFVGRLPWDVVAAGIEGMPVPDGMDEEMPERIEEYLRRKEEDPTWDEHDEEEESDDLAGDFLEQDSKADPWLHDDEDEEQEAQGEGAEGGPAGAGGEEQGKTTEASAQQQAATAPVKKRGRPKRSQSPPDQPPQPPPTDMADTSAQSAADASAAEPAAPEQAEEAVAAEQGDSEAVEAATESEGQRAGEEGEVDEESLWSSDPDVVRHVATEAAGDLLDRLEAGLDCAPFITLRLRDNEQTRSIWPHKFDLYLKLTVSEVDDFPSTEIEGDQFVTEDRGSIQAMMEDDVEAATKRIADHPPPVLPIGGRLDEETGIEVPTQLKVEILLKNKDVQDAEGSVAPMEFEMGALMQFAVPDLVKKGQFVQVLGLGKLQAIDYSIDERVPALMAEEHDYIYFLGQKIDATYLRGCHADVKFTPGDGTHYEFIPREGFTDVAVYHPGMNPNTQNDPYRELVGLGVGRLATPQKLYPGDEYRAEFVLRWHNHMWLEPNFGDGGMPFVPDLPAKEYQGSEEQGFTIMEDEEDEESVGVVAGGSGKGEDN